MKKYTLAAAVLISLQVLNLSSKVYASSSAKGTTSAEFLRLAPGARAVSMGEAYSAVTDEASALYWNVGALADIPTNSLTVMHALYLESSSFDYLAFGHNFGKKGALGVGVQMFSAGSIDQTDVLGNPSGSFKPSDRAITIGYGLKLQGYGLGLGIKSINSKIVDSASTLSADIGVLSPAFYREKLRFAFTGKNLIGSLKFKAESEKLPTEYRLGSSYIVNDNWGTSFDLAFPKSDETYAAVGTEYAWHLKDMSVVGRTGYNTKTSGDISGFTGFAFGFGVIIQKLNLDYGVIPFGSLGLAHRFSVSYSF